VRGRHIIVVCGVLSLFSLAHASGQLRPLEPFDWDALRASSTLQVSLRAAWLHEQRASLAGTIGELFELGEARVLWRVGSVVIELAGTPQRWFSDDGEFAAPTGGAESPPEDGQRHDSGDYRVATAVRLTSNGARSAVLRFGTRLPTTDNRVGLDRDQTDFFALLGADQQAGNWHLAGEAGVGINGTRVANYEQLDVLLYAVQVQRRAGAFGVGLTMLGQEDLKAREARHIRGNEDLGELRLSLRAGRQRWFEVVLVRGIREFSPELGVLIGAGIHFRPTMNR
jgi:hypothetical protein